MDDSGCPLWLVSRSYMPDEGGIQTYAREVAHGYARLGWRVTLFVKSSAGPRRFVDEGVTVVDVGPGSKLGVYLRLCAALVRAWAGGERPRAIHACTWRAAMPALLIPVPVVVTAHGQEVARPRGIACWAMRAVLARARRIVAVSDATRALLVTRRPSLTHKTVRAWNGTSGFCDGAFRARGAVGRAAPSILTLCRLVPRKNVCSAVAAVGGCDGGDRPLRYVVAGRGPEAGHVATAIRAHRGDAAIDQAGFVADDQVPGMYSAADIFLHPQIALENGSEVEGFGLVIADAMASGLTCIVGRDGGPSELIEHGVTGLVVDGTSVPHIRAALQSLIDAPEDMRRMAAAARAWATTHLCWTAHCRDSLAGVVSIRDAAAPAVPVAGPGYR